jgi:hypothetical protein
MTAARSAVSDRLHTPGLTADAVDRILQESYETTLY